MSKYRFFYDTERYMLPCSTILDPACSAIVKQENGLVIYLHELPAIYRCAISGLCLALMS